MKEENILLVNICKEKLHFNEFVKPTGDILIKNKIKGFIRHYTCLTKKDLEKSSKAIICGTSLKDNEFLHEKEIKRFNWIKKYKKPLLGVCGGMQIIGIIFGGKLNKNKEIGYYNEKFSKNFLGLKGKVEVYHLHNNFVDFSKISNFQVSSGRSISQAVKHKEKEIYGILFHPEVRNKNLILNFSKSN